MSYIEELMLERGVTVDFMLSKKRVESAAKAFFLKAIGSDKLPEKVTIDKNGANHAALNNVNAAISALEDY